MIVVQNQSLINLRNLVCNKILKVKKYSLIHVLHNTHNLRTLNTQIGRGKN